METSTDSTVLAPTVQPTIPPPVKLSRTRGLRPPWKKGQTGNGLGARSRQLPTKAKLQEALAAALKGGRLDELMSAWVQHAIDGNPGYLNAILQRLWPVDVQEQRSPLILSGIKLELGPEGATITMGQTQVPQAQDVTSSTGTESEHSEPTVTGSLSSDRREPEIVGVTSGGAQVEPVRIEGPVCESQPPA